VLDEKRGVVYLGTGSPSVDFYGGAREGANLFANCVLALEAETGELKWYFQTIRHDLWDFDLPCPPNLVTVNHNGKKVDAVVQTTKDGLVYVLDRDTGTSLFPLEEISVPASDVPGEVSWPTQIIPTKPLPFSRQAFTEADLPNQDTFPEAHAYAKQVYEKTRNGQRYIPPSLEGTLSFGISGGAEWGGNATDPQGILYQNAGEMAYIVKLTHMESQITESTTKGNALYLNNCSACHGIEGDAREGGNEGDQIPSLLNIGQRFSRAELLDVLKSGRGRMPSFQHIPGSDLNAIADYLLHVENKEATGKKGPQVEIQPKDFPYIPPYNRSGGGSLKDKNGYPAITPPWGTLNAIDLNTGDYLWRVPLGEFPELTEKGIPITGTDNAGGPVVTAGGLVFIAATKDERIRAFDSSTGEVVWEHQLPAGAFATPITYEVEGKQYLVIAVGGTRQGHKPGGWYMAFAL